MRHFDRLFLSVDFLRSFAIGGSVTGDFLLDWFHRLLYIIYFHDIISSIFMTLYQVFSKAISHPVMLIAYSISGIVACKLARSWHPRKMTCENKLAGNDREKISVMKSTMKIT